MDMILETWEGDWGLPSIDLFALQIMAYAKFSGAPLKLNKTNKPWHSPNGQLPVFRHGPKKRFSRFGDITAYLRGQNYNADFDLTKKQCSDVVAYSSLLRDKLYPAFLYVLWVDNKNYTELTRPWFIKVLPFPVKHFLPGYFQKKAQKIIYNFTGYDELEKEEMENFLLKEAQECLTRLSHRLGEDEFYFGKNPTSLDALIFGFLAILLQTPFPNATLQNHLKACGNLTHFVKRILQKYFPLSAEEMEAQRNKQEINTSQEDLDFPHKWQSWLFAGLFATVAMIGYAFASGLVQVEVLEDDEDEILDQPLEFQQ